MYIIFVMKTWLDPALRRCTEKDVSVSTPNDNLKYEFAISSLYSKPDRLSANSALDCLGDEYITVNCAAGGPWAKAVELL